jgi:hypothetical protein
MDRRVGLFRLLVVVPAVFLLAVLGCTNRREHLKPPKIREELRVPPSDEARFSRPIEYPKEVLNEDVLAKKATKSPLGALKGGKGGGAPGGFSN